MTKQSKLLNDVIDTVGEVIVLVKYSSKHEQLLESIQSNLECDDNGEGFGQAISSLSKLSVTRWKVRVNDIHESFQQLLKSHEVM